MYFPKNGFVACRVGCKFIHFVHFLQVLLYVLSGISMFILVFATYCRPGMNSCKITEDATTRALRALYMIPAPENNINDGGHDNATLGLGAATAPTSQGNMQLISTLGKLKGSHDGDVANTFDLADMSKPSKKPHAPSSRKPDGIDCFPKLKEKRKIAELLDKGELPKVLLNFTNTFLLF